MPLLICPNDNNQMLKITRDGVEIDMCPTCKGVWMDRGELEKLLTVSREDIDEQKQARARFDREVNDFSRDPDDWRRRHPYDAKRKRHRYDDDDRDDDDLRRKKRRGFDMFDIFDFD